MAAASRESGGEGSGSSIKNNNEIESNQK